MLKSSSKGAVVVKEKQLIFPGQSLQLQGKTSASIVTVKCLAAQNTISCFFMPGHVCTRFITRYQG